MRARTLTLAALVVFVSAVPQAQARDRHCACTPHWRHARVAHYSGHGVYHIPRFDQAEAEAEVHTQYLYRTPYLPYWVFP